MAKSKLDRDLFDNLRARGLRRRVARLLAEAPGSGSVPKQARQAVDDLRKLAGELEKRFAGEATRRSQAATKAARTRRRTAAKRSQAATKAAQTRRRTTAKRGQTKAGSTRTRSSSR